MKEKRCFLVTVTDQGEYDQVAYVVYQSAHSTHDRAVAALARWCRAAWEEQDHDEETTDDFGPRPGDVDAAAIDRYFGFWDEE